MLNTIATNPENPTNPVRHSSLSGLPPRSHKRHTAQSILGLGRMSSEPMAFHHSMVVSPSLSPIPSTPSVNSLASLKNSCTQDILQRSTCIQKNPFNIHIQQQIPLAYQIACQMNKSHLVSIEGNIGSGKSTLLHRLESHPVLRAVQSHIQCPLVVIKEPVSQWETIRDPLTNESIIQRFYQEPSKYAFSFQMMAYATRFKAIQQALEQYPNCVLITERCLETDKNIFASMLHDSKDIDSMEYQIYQTCYDAFTTVDTDQFIYVRTPVDTCFERIQQRNRSGEVVSDVDSNRTQGGIPRSYLQKCHDKHEEWMNGKPYHMIDGNLNYVHDSSIVDTLIQELLPLLNPHISKEYLDTLWKEYMRVHESSRAQTSTNTTNTTTPMKRIPSHELIQLTLNGC